MGAMVLHWVGISLARWSSFSSSSLDHSVFLMLGSNHSYLTTETTDHSSAAENRYREKIHNKHSEFQYFHLLGLYWRCAQVQDCFYIQLLQVLRLLYNSVTATHITYICIKTHHLALHCLADFRWSREAIRDHWFFPYFITAALRISSWIIGQITKNTDRKTKHTH